MRTDATPRHRHVPHDRRRTLRPGTSCRTQALRPWPVLVLLALLPLSANAHEGHAASGFVAGLLHPLTGFDHALAILAVGWWNALGNARSAAVLPAIFLAAMLAGALLAGFGIVLRGSEWVIAASLLGLGALLWQRSALPFVPAAMLMALFAFAHGSAHGRELGHATAGGWLFGMLFATCALQLIGIGVGCALRNRARWVGSLSGAMTASAGAACVVALLAG